MTLTYFLNDTKLGKVAQNKLGEGETYYARLGVRKVRLGQDSLPNIERNAVGMLFYPHP